MRSIRINYQYKAILHYNPIKIYYFDKKKKNIKEVIIKNSLIFYFKFHACMSK